MEQPVQSASVPACPQARPRRSNDAGLWLIAAALVAVSAYALWWQSPATNPLAPTLADRWLKPVEFNPPARFPLVPAADLHALWFFSEREGLAAGEKGVLLRTVDGGRSWRRIPLPAGDGTAVADGIYALAFAPNDSRRGYLAGRNGLWLMTTDAGERWSDFRLGGDAFVTLPPQAQQYAPQNVKGGFDPRFAVQNTAKFADPKLALAQNAAPADAADGGPPHIYALALAQDQAFAATSRGVVRRSLDGTNAMVLARTDGWQVAATDSHVWWTSAVGYASAGLHDTPDDGAGPAQHTGWFDAVGARGDTLLLAGSRVALARADGVVEPIGLADPRGDGRARVWSCALASNQAGWIVGDAGHAWRVTRTDHGALQAENRAVPGFARPLYAVWAFSEDAAVIAGDDGALFRTTNGGRTWAPMTANCWPATARGGRHWWRFPAFWFYPAFGLMAWVGYRRWRTRPALCIEHDAIASELATDRAVTAAEEDRLGFVRHVNGLSRYLRNAATEPPLTLAITGAWGSGKTSFMNLLRADLQKHGLSTVWFNAWHHQQESQILAPLLQAIRSEGTPAFFSARADVALRFRLRLLWRRLVAQRVLIFVLLVLLCLALGVRERLSAVTPIDALAQGVTMLGDEKSVEQGLANLVGGGSFIGLVLGFGLLAWRTAVLFGVNPASLLATESGKSSQLALSEQTNFRRLFAARFQEVTDALKPYPLVVFVDDLDRCTAAKIFQILEAINYVVSSGDCFVVLGMDEDRLRESVARYFLVASPEAPAGDGVGDDHGADLVQAGANPDWVRAHTTAKNYLEKLVQLKVEVPASDADAMSQLAAPRPATETTGGLRERRGWRLAALGAVASVAACGMAFFGGRAIAPAFSHEPAPRGETGGGGTARATANAASVMPPELRTLQFAGLEDVNAAPLFRERDLTITDPQPGARDWSGAIAAVIGAIGVVLAAMLAQRELQRRQVTVLKDSAEFARASARWSQELRHRLGESFTPRALKRFKNRVRYYAMALREETVDDKSPLRDRVIVTIGALEQVGIRPQDLSGRPVSIPLPKDLRDAAEEAAAALLDTETTIAFEKLSESTQVRA